MSEKKEEERTYKVVLVGESGVGKTCIINQFVNKTFEPETSPTQGTKFSKKELILGKESINFNIWDTPGLKKYHDFAKLFYKGATSIILVYDVTSQKSFDELKNYWYNEIKNLENEKLVIAVAANKSDLIGQQAVINEKGKAFADEIGAIFGITSAKTNTGIQALFDNIGRKILDPNFDYAANEKKMKDNSENKMRVEEKTEKKPVLTSPVKKCCGLENCKNCFK